MCRENIVYRIENRLTSCLIFGLALLVVAVQQNEQLYSYPSRVASSTYLPWVASLSSTPRLLLSWRNEPSSKNRDSAESTSLNIQDWLLI